jgi:hypothetical protein
MSKLSKKGDTIFSHVMLLGFLPFTICTSWKNGREGGGFNVKLGFMANDTL